MAKPDPTFTACLKHVRRWLNAPRLVVKFRVGRDGEFVEDRAFAYCEDETGEAGGVWIVVASDFREQPKHRRLALMRHEFGHAIEFVYGRAFVLNLLDKAGYSGEWFGPERRADALAELVWGNDICYDAADVQTLGAGVRPRPRRLGL